jgi:hypothetical protein
MPRCELPNWTGYTSFAMILARSVLMNPYGQPEFLLNGGYGKKRWYEEPCWPLYRTPVCFVSKNGNGNTRIWSTGTNERQ